MVQDFTKIGLQHEASDETTELTHVVRQGVQRRTGLAGISLALDKLRGKVPLGADASSKAMRKTLAGASELLALLKHGLAAAIFLVLGAAVVYVAVKDSAGLVLLGTGLGCLAIGALTAKWAAEALKNLRAITKA